MIGRTRRDLDDVSVRTLVPLASCRRQFDNLRQVAHRVEESPTDLHKLIKRKFLLSEGLVKSYSSAIFLNHHQIDVSRHASVQAVSLYAMLECSQIFIQYWSVDRTSIAFDSGIAHDIRDIRSDLIGCQNSWVDRAVASISDVGWGKKELAGSELTLRTLLKNCLQIGCGLVHNREIKDLLVDIIELVVTPILQDLQLDSKKATVVFQIMPSLLEVSPNSSAYSPRVRASFALIVDGLAACTRIIIADLASK